MSLSKEEIDRLLRLICLRRDGKIDCDRCLTLVAELADRELKGRSIAAGQEAPAHHLSVCTDCCEEYQALMRALKAMDE